MREEDRLRRQRILRVVDQQLRAHNEVLIELVLQQAYQPVLGLQSLPGHPIPEPPAEPLLELRKVPQRHDPKPQAKHLRGYLRLRPTQLLQSLHLQMRELREMLRRYVLE